MSHASRAKVRSRDAPVGGTSALAAVIIAVAAAARLATWAHDPTQWDSVLLGQGLRHFDVRAESPHAPGYVLFVLGGRLVWAITPLSVHDALLFLAFLASLLSVWVVFRCGLRIGDRAGAVVVAAALAFAPLSWFFGSIVASYAWDALAAAVLCLLLLRARPGSNDGIYAAFVLTAAGGMRPSGVLLLAPLALAVALRSIRSPRQAGWAMAAGLAGLALWLVPIALLQSRGVGAWKDASDKIFDGAMDTTSPLRHAPEGRRNVGTSLAYVVVNGLPLLPAALVGWAASFGRRARRAIPWFTVAALGAGVAGPVLFYALVHFGNAGYSLVYLPPLFLLMCLPIGWARGLLRGTIVVLALAGVAIGALRFVTADGLLPPSALEHRLWFTQAHYWAPYPETFDTIRDADKDFATLRTGFDTIHPEANRDVVVMLRDKGGHMYAAATELVPHSDVVLIDGNRASYVARDHSWHADPPPELRSDGRVILVTSGPTDEGDALVADGKATVLVETPGSGYRVGFYALELHDGAVVRGLPVVTETD